MATSTKARTSTRCGDERCKHILKKHVSVYGRCNELDCPCTLYRPNMSGLDAARAALDERNEKISVSLTRDQWRIVRYLVAGEYDAALRASARAHERNQPENYADSLARAERAKPILEVLNERTKLDGRYIH